MQIHPNLPGDPVTRDPQDSIATRQSLLVGLKDLDNASAWRDFFENYWQLIYNFARKAGLNDPEAQEVVQETVLAVARKIGDFQVGPGHGSFKSWLLGQARWRIGDQFRARKRDARLFSTLPDSAGGIADDTTGSNPQNRLAAPSEDPLQEMWDAEWERHLLSLSLKRVKAKVGIKQFQMFDLHVRKGLSIADTARAVGSTKAAVYMAKSRVSRVLRGEVQALNRL